MNEYFSEVELRSMTMLPSPCTGMIRLYVDVCGCVCICGSVDGVSIGCVYVGGVRYKVVGWR